MESVWILKLDLRFLMYSISKTKQSNFPWHFLKTLKLWLSELLLLSLICRNLIDKRQVKINICKLQSINTIITMGDKSNGLLVIKSFTVGKEH